MSLTGSLTLQLDITRKLIQTMDRVITSLEKTNNITSDQSDIVNGMNESLTKQQELLDKSSDTMNDSINELDKALKKNEEASSQNKFMNSLTEYRKHMKNSSAKRYFFLDPMKKLKANIGSTFENLIEKVKNTKLGVKVLKKYASIKSQFKDFSKAIKNANGTLEVTILILKGLKEVITTTIKGVASFGFGFVAKIISALISGVINVIKSATSIVLKFFKITLTLPFQIAQIAASIGGKIRKEIVETFYQAREDAKKTFDLTSSIGEGVKKLTSITIGSLKSFEYTNSNLTRLFGYGSQGAAQMMKFTLDNVAAMGHFSEIFGKSLMSNSDSIEFLARAQKAMNMSTEDISYMALTAASNGESIYNTIDRTREALQTISEQSGVDFKRLSTNFFKLRKDIVEFGHLSDIELSKTVSRITQLGVKTEDVTNVFKQFSTFESAAQSAAQLYQTFGMNIDAFTLISERDPAKIIDMFRQGMYETGRSFEDLNRHEKALMSQFTGLSAESLKSAMNFRNMNLSYAELKEKMKAEDTTEKQIKTIDGLKSSITQLQKTLQFKSPFEAFFSGLTKSMAYNKEMYGELMGLSNIYESIHNFALSIDKKTLKRLLSPIVDVIRVMKSVFSSKGFKKALKGGLQAISELSLSITKSVFSPKFIKDIDDLSVKFASSNIKTFKSKNKTLFKIIKGSFNDKKTGKHIRRALLKSGASIKKLSKMTTEEMINAVKKASYEFGNDLNSRKAMISLTEKINAAYSAEFNTKKVKNAVIKNNNPVEAVNKFVDKITNLMGENEELGRRIIDVAGTLMGQIIKGGAAGGLAVTEEINRSLKGAEDTNEEKIKDGLKKKTGLKGFDWKSLKDAYDIEFMNLSKNKKVIAKFAAIAARSFKGIAKEIGNILVDMLESVYYAVLSSDSTIGKMAILLGSEGIMSAVGLKSMKKASNNEFKKYKNDKEFISKNKFSKRSKGYVGKSNIFSEEKMKSIAKLSDAGFAEAKLLAHRSLFQIAKNTWEYYDKLNTKDNNRFLSGKIKLAYDQYEERFGEKAFALYAVGGVGKSLDKEPEEHYSLILEMFHIVKDMYRDRNRDPGVQHQNRISALKKSLETEKYGDYQVGSGIKGLTDAYTKKIIDDGDFTNINADKMRIISNGTMYIPSDQDQGEFIVWKKDGAIYNMFNKIKTEFDQEINKVEAKPVTIDLNNRRKKISDKQIKDIVMKLNDLNEALKNRKVKVNQTTKTETGEILA